MRFPFLGIFFVGLLTSAAPLFSQTNLEADADMKRQLIALREAVIQQTRQIDALTAEIERLGIALGQRRPTAAATPAETPIVNTAGVTGTVVPVPVATPTPDSGVIQHTVVKGDNLTNLSKKYGTTVEAIQKLNKVTDARKMQVGQILAIPVPTPTASPKPPAAKP